jgi:hypothetical protein
MVQEDSIKELYRMTYLCPHPSRLPPHFAGKPYQQCRSVSGEFERVFSARLATMTMDDIERTRTSCTDMARFLTGLCPVWRDTAARAYEAFSRKAQPAGKKGSGARQLLQQCSSLADYEQFFSADHVVVRYVKRLFDVWQQDASTAAAWQWYRKHEANDFLDLHCVLNHNVLPPFALLPNCVCEYQGYDMETGRAATGFITGYNNTLYLSVAIKSERLDSAPIISRGDSHRYLESWFLTDGGGAYGVAGHVDSAIAGCTHDGTGSRCLLPTTQAVAEWVGKQAAAMPPCVPTAPNIDSRLVGTVMLAIFPGYYPPNATEEERCFVFDAFANGLKQSCGDAFGGAFVAYLDYMLSKGLVPELRRALDRLPARAMGFLMAHDMSSDATEVKGGAAAVWRSRYPQARLEACRYQILHPGEKYRHNFEGTGRLFQTPWIERLSAAERAPLLSELGLSEDDVQAARARASAFSGEGNGGEYNELLLKHLFHRIPDNDDTGMAALPALADA